MAEGLTDPERKAVIQALRARMRDESGTFHELLRGAVEKLAVGPSSGLPDFADAYNAATGRYTGNLAADLSDCGVPWELGQLVAKRCAEWASARAAPPAIAAALGFYMGVMTGVEWERMRR